MSNTPLTHWYGICERSGTGMFDEPLNVISSLAFIYVAVTIYRHYKNHEDLERKWIWDVHALTFLTFLIGVNSIIFHMFPTPTTELADVVTIVLFIVLYFWSVLFRINRTSFFSVLICFIAFVGFTHILVHQFPRAMNNSIGYLSTMIALSMIAVHLHLRARPSSSHFLLAALIGVFSLFCRVIDREVCGHLFTGTHFMWHICNATLIYILLKQLVRNVNRVARLKRQAGDSTMI